MRAREKMETISNLWCVAKNGLTEPRMVNVLKECKNSLILDQPCDKRVLKDFDGELYNTYCRFFTNKESAFKYYKKILWSNKYKNISSTKTLSLPMWDEVKTNEMKRFFDFNHNLIELRKFASDFEIWVNDNFCIFDKECSEETWIEACEICRKLFIGEMEL